MGYWVYEIRIDENEIESLNDAMYICCDSMKNCEDCRYEDIVNVDCYSVCAAECHTIDEVFEKFGFRYVESEQEDATEAKEPNPDWPPICNYIGVPPHTDFKIDDTMYQINANGYITNEEFIVSGMDVYKILNHPELIKIIPNIPDETKALVIQLHNAWPDGSIYVNKGNEAFLCCGGLEMPIDAKYFKDYLMVDKHYPLSELIEDC